MKKAAARTFASFRIRNFRLYMFGQGLSLCGTWMQTVAVSWLVLQLTHSGMQLGLVVAAQFLPMLIFGVWGGLIADRFEKRRVLYITQSIAGFIALLLGLLVVTHTIQLWMIYVLITLLGLSMVVDTPTRQTFVVEMVGERYLKNAITINSIVVNTARIIGPSFAGILIATVGIGECFLVNAASYAAVLIALLFMRRHELHTTPRAPKQSGQIKAGLRYIWRTPALRATLAMMFILGTFAYEFPVVMPLFATLSLHGGAATYSAMTAAMGVGAIVGGLYSAGRGGATVRRVTQVAVLFGLSLLLLAAMPGLVTALLVLVPVGALSVLFISLGNTTLQLTSAAMMRGRVMSVWSIGFFGTTPIGGPIIGAIADHTNPRIGLAVGGVSALVAAGLSRLLVFPR